MYICRAIARSENPGGHIVLGGDNVSPLVEIGLTDLSKNDFNVLDFFCYFDFVKMEIRFQIR